MREHGPGPFSQRGPSRPRQSPGDHSQGWLARGMYLATASQRQESECAQSWLDWRVLKIQSKMTEVVWVGPSGTTDGGEGSGRVGHQVGATGTKKAQRDKAHRLVQSEALSVRVRSHCEVADQREISGRRCKTPFEGTFPPRRRSAPKRELPGMSCAAATKLIWD